MRWALIIGQLCDTVAARVPVPTSQPPVENVETRQPACARSSLLAGLEWLGPPFRYPGSGTDMHWCSWGDDDALYVVDDDGANFGGSWNFAHLLRVTGTPPDHLVEEISLFPE